MIDQAIKSSISRAVGYAIDVGLEGAVAPDIWVDPAVDPKRIMDGANIETLEKIEGTLADFTQGTPADRPFYQSSGINGLGSVEITGGTQTLESANSVASSQISFVASFAFQYTIDGLAAGNHYIFSISFGSAQYLLSVDGATRKLFSRPIAGASVGAFLTDATLAVDTPAVLTLIYDVPNSNHELRMNGITIGSSSSMIGGSYTSHNIRMLKHVTTVTSTSGFQMGAYIHNRLNLPPLYQIKARERYLMERYLP